MPSWACRLPTASKPDMNWQMPTVPMADAERWHCGRVRHVGRSFRARRSSARDGRSWSEREEAEPAAWRTPGLSKAHNLISFASDQCCLTPLTSGGPPAGQSCERLIAWEFRTERATRYSECRSTVGGKRRQIEKHDKSVCIIKDPNTFKADKVGSRRLGNSATVAVCGWRKLLLYERHSQHTAGLNHCTGCLVTRSACRCRPFQVVPTPEPLRW